MHFKAPDIGLDLGTCNTVVYVKNEGIVISEPTLVISRRGDKKPIAVGEDAQRMYGRTSDAGNRHSPHPQRYDCQLRRNGAAAACFHQQGGWRKQPRQAAAGHVHSVGN